MNLKYYESPFHATHDKETADKMCKEVDDKLEIHGILDELEHGNFTYDEAVNNIMALINNAYQSGREFQRNSDRSICLFHGNKELASVIEYNTSDDGYNADGMS